tara:strand:- start:1382 stop:2662 length:1281 start_codon:yes stop_codon:yes gene_type:complete
MPYIGVSPAGGVRKVFSYTATAGQTSFSGSDNNSATLSYSDSNFVDVFQNGVLLLPSDYTATTGTSVVLDTGATVSDSIQITVFDVFSAADTVSKADGGTFDGNITMGGTLGVTGATTLSGNLSVDGGSIKLDGNYPTGTSNVALGDQALDSLTSGGYSVAIGNQALTAMTDGNDNVAVGQIAMSANTSGSANTAVGQNSMQLNTTGGSNTAIGALALDANQTANNNTAIGYSALGAATGSDNTAIGKDAGKAITSGQKNTIVGGFDGNENNLDIRTAEGFTVMSSGDGYPVAVTYPPADASYGNVAHWESHVKRTTQPANRADSIVIGMARISLISGSATNISNGYFGSLVMVNTHAQSAPYNYQYTMLITHGWNSASVLFTNSYGGNTTTITASASSGVLRLTQSSGTNLEATIISFLGSYMNA